MIIRITSLNVNMLFVGKTITFDALRTSVTEIFKKHDRESFVPEFCARFGYQELPYSEGYADYMIDLDEQFAFVTTHTFPTELDGAKVLYFTEKGVFDPVYNVGGGIAHKVFYLAICKYDDSKFYYLFYLDENLEVVADGCLENIEDCRKYINEYDVEWHKHKEKHL